jgi:hypothetical protein
LFNLAIWYLFIWNPPFLISISVLFTRAKLSQREILDYLMEKGVVPVEKKY